MQWAKGVAEESKKEHKKEIHRRKSFTKQFGQFISLFPSLVFACVVSVSIECNIKDVNVWETI